MLPDHEIRDHIKTGRVTVDPAPLDTQIQPASLDIRLGHKIAYYRPRTTPVRFTDLPDDLTETVDITAGWTIRPGAFALATTMETIRVPDDMVVLLHGRSSLGRLGITIHVTAGLVDPGFAGTVVLEVAHTGSIPVELHPGDRIGQLTFHPLTSPAQVPYGAHGLGSHYMNQTGPQAPRSSR